MKKLILATVSAVALLGMAACSDSGTGTRQHHDPVDATGTGGTAGCSG